MIVTIKYFYEKNDADYRENSKLWDENTGRMIYLPTDLSLSQQVCSIKDDFEKNNNKDILVIFKKITLFIMLYLDMVCILVMIQGGIRKRFGYIVLN
jgi:hypothetical protein